MTTEGADTDDPTLSPPVFAVVLFVTVVAVAVLAEVPLATIVDRPVSFGDAVRNGLFAGGVFAGIYLIGTGLMTFLDGRSD